MQLVRYQSTTAQLTYQQFRERQAAQQQAAPVASQLHAASPRAVPA